MVAGLFWMEPTPYFMIFWSLFVAQNLSVYFDGPIWIFNNNTKSLVNYSECSIPVIQTKSIIKICFTYRASDSNPLHPRKGCQRSYYDNQIFLHKWNFYFYTFHVGDNSSPSLESQTLFWVFAAVQYEWQTTMQMRSFCYEFLKSWIFMLFGCRSLS